MTVPHMCVGLVLFQGLLNALSCWRLIGGKDSEQTGKQLIYRVLNVEEAERSVYFCWISNQNNLLLKNKQINKNAQC